MRLLAKRLDLPGDVLPERSIHLAQVLLQVDGTLVILTLGTHIKG